MQRAPPGTPGAYRPPKPVMPTQPEGQGITVQDKEKILEDAADNFVLVEIWYDGLLRLVEPYSCKDGMTGRLFFGHCDIHNRIHSFLIHKIQYLKVTETRFAPKWARPAKNTQ